MKILDPGHCYELEVYDGEQALKRLVFMKRFGPKYPGNTSAYPGTNCQEVIRVLIDRVKYLDKQVHCSENETIIMLLREALFEFEQRAARRKGRLFDAHLAKPIDEMPVCKECGHIQCEHL